MKRFSLLMILALFVASIAYADYTVTLDEDLDYYESDTTGFVVQPYQASPTLTTLRDMLILAGIMEAAPPGAVAEPNAVFLDNANAVFLDNGNAVFLDPR